MHTISWKFWTEIDGLASCLLPVSIHSNCMHLASGDARIALLGVRSHGSWQECSLMPTSNPISNMNTSSLTGVFSTLCILNCYLVSTLFITVTWCPWNTAAILIELTLMPDANNSSLQLHESFPIPQMLLWLLQVKTSNLKKTNLRQAEIIFFFMLLCVLLNNEWWAQVIKKRCSLEQKESLCSYSLNQSNCRSLVAYWQKSWQISCSASRYDVGNSGHQVSKWNHFFFNESMTWKYQFHLNMVASC